jgi:predicted nucleic acid-binding protein
VNVFVETNFVIELALEQQQAPACADLLALAEQSAIRLFIPAYSLIEPHETLTRRHLDRATLRSRVSTELAQLARSTPLAQRVAASQDIVNLLVDSAEYETRRVDDVKARICGAAEVLPITLDVVRSAATHQNAFDLSAQDAVVYASIRAHLDTDHADPSCFISRNPRDFADPDVRADLATMNCRYFASFDPALAYVRHALGRPPGA